MNWQASETPVLSEIYGTQHGKGFDHQKGSEGVDADASLLAAEQLHFQVVL